MTTPPLADLPHEQLARLAESYLRTIQAVDGYWFLGVEERYGTAAALAIDQEVWQRTGRGDGERLKRALGLEGGSRALEAGLAYGTCPGTSSAFEVSQQSPTRTILKVTRCFPQEARLKAGKGVFDCQGVCLAHFQSFAQALDPRFRVSCASSLPGDSRPGLWCVWNFDLEKEEG